MQKKDHREVGGEVFAKRLKGSLKRTGTKEKKKQIANEKPFRGKKAYEYPREGIRGLYGLTFWCRNLHKKKDWVAKDMRAPQLKNLKGGSVKPTRAGVARGKAQNARSSAKRLFQFFKAGGGGRE